MSKKLYLQDRFYGGLSDDDAQGTQASFAYDEQVDFRTTPGVITGVYAPTKATSTVLAALPKWIAQLGTSVYVYGADNHIYKSGSPWTDAHTNGQTGVGNGMEVMGTKLYYAANAKLGSYDGAATWTDAAFTFKTGTAGSWHPMKVFSPAGGLCIGDGRYIAVLDYDGVTYADGSSGIAGEGITLPLDTVVKCLEVWNDYLVIGTYKGTNVYDDNIATLYFWDGTSTTYTYKIDLNESGIHALQTTAQGLMIVAGVRGNIYQYNGGSPVLIKRIPSAAKVGSTYNEVYPGAITQCNGMTLVGFAGAGTDATSVKGVYSWGTINKNYPNVLNLEYLISTGTKAGTTCLISSVKAINDTTLYIGWRDNTAYGVDLVSTANKVASCTLQSLWFDGGTPFAEKIFTEFYMYFNAMLANETITLKYRKDSESSFTTIGAITSTGENFWKQGYSIQCRRIQLQVVLSGSSNTLPSIQSFGGVFTVKDFI